MSGYLYRLCWEVWMGLGMYKLTKYINLCVCGRWWGVCVCRGHVLLMGLQTRRGSVEHVTQAHMRENANMLAPHLASKHSLPHC